MQLLELLHNRFAVWPQISQDARTHPSEGLRNTKGLFHLLVEKKL
jgi:hypothetical protein